MWRINREVARRGPGGSAPGIAHPLIAEGGRAQRLPGRSIRSAAADAAHHWPWLGDGLRPSGVARLTASTPEPRRGHHPMPGSRRARTAITPSILSPAGSRDPPRQRSAPTRPGGVCAPWRRRRSGRRPARSASDYIRRSVTPDHWVELEAWFEGQLDRADPSSSRSAQRSPPHRPTTAAARAALMWTWPLPGLALLPVSIRRLWHHPVPEMRSSPDGSAEACEPGSRHAKSGRAPQARAAERDRRPRSEAAASSASGEISARRLGPAGRCSTPARSWRRRASRRQERAAQSAPSPSSLERQDLSGLAVHARSRRSSRCARSSMRVAYRRRRTRPWSSRLTKRYLPPGREVHPVRGHRVDPPTPPPGLRRAAAGVSRKTSSRAHECAQHDSCVRDGVRVMARPCG
jgi:hypothetical protein